MSFLRPLRLHPSSLRMLSLERWLQHLLSLIRDLSLVRPRCQSDIGLNDHLVRSSSKRPSVHLMRDYMSGLLTPSLEEELFHHLIRVCSKEFVLPTLHKALVTVFEMFFKAHFKLLQLPPLPPSEHRVMLLEIVLHTLEERTSSTCTRSARLRLFDCSAEMSVEESYVVRRLLRSLNHLTVLVLHWVCDDAMLSIVGDSFQHLEVLDLWKSSRITDLGLGMLLTRSFVKSDYCTSSLVCSTLRCLGLRDTSVSHLGIVMVVTRCPNLQVVRFNPSAGLATAFLATLKETIIGSNEQVKWGLRSLFVPLSSNSNFELALILKALPHLQELRLWTTHSRLRSLTEVDLQDLQSVLLGGLHSEEVMLDALHLWGEQLTTLKLESLLIDLNLHLIGEACPRLQELQVINSCLKVSNNHDCSSVHHHFLANLKLVHFSLVTYSSKVSAASVVNQPPKSALHCLLTHARSLEALQASATCLLSDADLTHILRHSNPLTHLRQLALNPVHHLDLDQDEDYDKSLRLGLPSLLALINSCSELVSLGDLRAWASLEGGEVLQRIAAGDQHRRKWTLSTTH